MFYVDAVFTSFHIILLWFEDETLVPNVFDIYKIPLLVYFSLYKDS